MSLVGILIGILSAVGAYYVYTMLKKLKLDFIEDISTIKNSLEEYADNTKNDIKMVQKTAVDANSGSIKLVRSIVENNALAKATLKTNKNLKDKKDYFPIIDMLINNITDRSISVTDVAVTASGFKVNIPFGQFVFSFKNNTLRTYKEGTNTFNINKIKSLLSKIK